MLLLGRIWYRLFHFCPNTNESAPNSVDPGPSWPMWAKLVPNLDTIRRNSTDFGRNRAALVRSRAFSINLHKPRPRTLICAMQRDSHLYVRSCRGGANNPFKLLQMGPSDCPLARLRRAPPDATPTHDGRRRAPSLDVAHGHLRHERRGPRGPPTGGAGRSRARSCVRAGAPGGGMRRGLRGGRRSHPRPLTARCGTQAHNHLRIRAKRTSSPRPRRTRERAGAVVSEFKLLRASPSG